MNKKLLLIVLLLLPITIVTEREDATQVMAGTTLENARLEIPILEEQPLEEEKITQVLVSNERDKSNPFYLDLEEYVIGVVAGEMPASFEMEALKAQAVASRTYAMYKMVNMKDYILSTTINDQVYLTEDEMRSKWGSDYEYYYNRVKEAVQETEGQVLNYDGKLAVTYYFAISNGYTESAQTVFHENRAYLIPVESSWDKNYQSYSSTRTISRSNFCSKLSISCDSITIGDVIRADNHYVRSVVINGKSFTGLEIFNRLSLKSTDFTISINGDDVSITTLGFGHGVGMSQYGAQGMAKEGYTYQDILTHYYQNTEISKI